MTVAAPPLSLVEAAAIPVVPQEDKVTSIDIGRQLFVDDYLIKDTTLKRTFHQANLYADAPILKPETKLEREGGTAEGAVLFDGGVWFDPKDQLFKIWYTCGFRDGICYASSKDGIRWDRPQLDVSPGENRVLPYHKGWELSGFSVALDQFTSDPAQRFKMLAYHRYKNRFPGDKGEENPPDKMYVSADGIHWGEPQFVKCFVGDNASMFFDPFRRYWVFSTRNRTPGLSGRRGSNGKPVTVRARFRFEGPDFLQAGLTANKALLWLKADALDKPDPALGYEPEIYTFGAVAYESIMLGAYGMFYGPPNDIAGTKGKERPKINDVQLGFSRDGVAYPRPSRTAFIAAARQPGVWNRGYRRRESRGMVRGWRLRRAHVLHHAGVLPGPQRLGEAEQGSGWRGGPGTVCRALRHGVNSISRRQAQVRRGQGHRPAWQRGDAGPHAR